MGRVVDEVLALVEGNNAQIGLAAVRQIVEKHGGEIRARADGRGLSQTLASESFVPGPAVRPD